MKFYFIIPLVFLFNISFGQIFSTDNAHAEVKGETAMASYTGESDKLKGKVNFNTKQVEFEIPLQSIETGNNLRDKDMHEVLESSKFPMAKFTGEIAPTFDPAQNKSQKVVVKGNFTIHGVTKPLEVTAELTPQKNGILFLATWPISITEYKIERPRVFFMRVDDKHQITINGTLALASE